RVLATVDKDPRAAQQEIAHGGRHVNRTLARGLLNAGGEIHGEPDDVPAVANLDLTRMEPRTDRQADPRQLPPQLRTTGDSLRGTFEGDQQAVAHVFHQRSPMMADRLPGNPIVPLQGAPPSVVSKLRGPRSRSDDVGEEHGREVPFTARRGYGARDEFDPTVVALAPIRHHPEE